MRDGPGRQQEEGSTSINSMLVALDFDGTITSTDVSDELFAEFGDFHTLSSQLLAGECTVAEYYVRALESMGARCSPDTLRKWLDHQVVDSGFVSLIQWLQAKNIRTVIISDGFDAYIKPILAREGVSDVPIYSNRMTWNGRQWEAEFPGASDGCSCFCASCKRNAAITVLGDNEILVYVGDGRSDECVVNHADVVFAKGSLAAYCSEHRVPHHPFTTLSDVQRILASKLTTGVLRQRRQAVLARRSAFEAE